MPAHQHALIYLVTQGKWSDIEILPSTIWAEVNDHLQYIRQPGYIENDIFQENCTYPGISEDPTAVTTQDASHIDDDMLIDDDPPPLIEEYHHPKT